MVSAGSSTEADLFRPYWEDGLLDVLCGLAILVTGLGWQLGLGPLAAVQAPLWVTLWSPLRQRIVEPHAGFVRFSVARRQKSVRDLRWTLSLGFGLLALLALTILLLQEAEPDAIARTLVPGLPALLVAIAAALTTVLTGARRFQAYGLALVAAAVATVALGSEPPLALAAGGLLALVSGAILLTRFIRDSREYDERDQATRP